MVVEGCGQEHLCQLWSVTVLTAAFTLLSLTTAGALLGNSQVMQVGVWCCPSEAEEAAAFCLPHSTSLNPQLNSS